VLQYGYHNDKEKKVGLYFAKDGNYGDATDLVLIDASNWENLDFRILDEASDDDRSRTAQLIQKWIDAGRPEIMDDRSDTYGMYLNLEGWFENE
jgi:hypothetical protein